MTWAKLDDRLWADPRTEAAGVEAMGLWVLATSWMGAYGTNGLIPKERVRRFAGRSGHWLAERLVKAGWWLKVSSDAYQLIGWEAYLLETVQTNLPPNLGRTSSESNAKVKGTSGEPPNEPPPVRENDGPRESRGETPRAGARPDPDPTRPDPDPEKKQNPEGANGSGEQPALPGLEDAVPKPDAIELAVFAEYIAHRTQKGRPPVLDEKRKAMVRGRLADGFTLEDLKAAARGIWRSEFHTSPESMRKGFCGFEYVVRDAAAVERFRLLGFDPLPRPAPADEGPFREPPPVPDAEVLRAARSLPRGAGTDAVIAKYEARIAAAGAST